MKLILAPQDAASRDQHAGKARLPSTQGHTEGAAHPGVPQKASGEADVELLRSLLALQEQQQKLLAYEIHDGLTQMLTATLYRLQAFQDAWRQRGEEAQKHLDAAVDMLRESIAESRRLIGGLSPPALDEAGVGAALNYLIGEIQDRTGVSVQFTYDVEFERLPPDLEHAIFRLVQEPLNNAVRHSGSDRVMVEVKQSGQLLRIKVQDWGKGFDPEKVPADRFGLRSIRDRARLLGGKATVRSAPGQGTEVDVEIPLAAN